MVEVSRALMKVHNHHLLKNGKTLLLQLTHMPVVVVSSSSPMSRACLLQHPRVDTLAGSLSCRAEGSRHPGLPKSAPLVSEALSVLKVGRRAQCANYTRLFHMAGRAHEDTGGHCRQRCFAAERSTHRALQVPFPHMLLLVFILVSCVALDCESSSSHTLRGVPGSMHASHQSLAGRTHDDAGGHCRQWRVAAQRSQHRSLQVPSTCQWHFLSAHVGHTICPNCSRWASPGMYWRADNNHAHAVL